MEADGLKLSDAEVRERFSAYHDGELPADEAAFVRQRLAEDTALAAEYQSFRKLLGGLASLSLDSSEEIRKAEASTAGTAGHVDLLAGVQQRLNKRSGGKFYRTRWSRAVGVVPLEAVAAVVLVLLVLAYVSMTYISELRSAEGVNHTVPAPRPDNGTTTQPR